ncbi:MAG: tRNA (guanosine(46)-N7)-methyltransferase TrmB [Lachnospiraceae bacterium]|nr:tRNA (guanosine(46)-N7)-methyltransferase TrmB [Lachnospiraceae bacterium]
MRLRNITGSRELIADSPFCISNPETYRGRWHELFQNNHPLYIEIGMGKGQFLMEHARRNPEINYIGIEKYSSVLLRAVEKMETEELPNLRFIRFDAEYITNIFDQGEIDRIYLNFSDPWPKDRHAKRRLTSRQFLARYREILNAGKIIEFKTDNRPLFDFSLEEVKESDYTLLAFTYDLHHDEELCQGNIMTEYEEKFSSLGNPIHKMMVTPNA